MRATAQKMLTAVPALMFTLLLLAVWQIGVKATAVNPVILPPPTAVLGATVANFGLLMGDLAVTIREVIGGFFLGLVTGMLAGVVIVYSRTAERVLYPLVIASQAVPVFAFAPLLVIWFGFGIVPKLIMAAVLVFFPICVNQVEGLRSADARTIDMMRAFGASEWQIFRAIRLPSSVPFLVAGVQVGITFAVVGAVVAEWLGASQGLGYRMVVSNAISRTSLVFGAIFVTAALGIVMFVLVRLLANRAFPWIVANR